MSSLSKTLAPGIRSGFIVANRELIRELRALRRLMLRHPAANNERSVGLFLAMGHHDALLRRLRQSYAERSQLVAAALRTHLPGVRFTTVAGASSFWLRFADHVDTRAIAAAAARMGVLIEPGDVFFVDGQRAGADELRAPGLRIDRCGAHRAGDRDAGRRLRRSGRGDRLTPRARARWL